MPVYRGQLDLEDAGPEVPVVHLFDYSPGDDHQQANSRYRKQLVALDSCIYLNRRSLAQVKAKKERTQPKSSKPETNGTDVHNGACEGKDEEEEAVTNGHSECNGDVNTDETSADPQKASGVSSLLKEGHEFEGYVLKCPNGPYDYAMKIWDHGRAAPQEVEYPKEGTEVTGMVVDRNGDYLTIACGPNIAYATRKSFLVAGVDPDDLSLPFARLRVSLSKATTRPPEVPAAAWVARPTQVVVPPYDIY